MAYQLKNRNRESGMVLVTVLMIVFVMITFCAGILSQSLTQATSSQWQVEQIRADEITKGVFWKAYANAATTGSLTADTSSTTYNGRTYQPGPSGSSTPGASYTITVSY